MPRRTSRRDLEAALADARGQLRRHERELRALREEADGPPWSLALRILGVFNLADLDPLDSLALIACLAECLADDFDAEHLFTQGLT